jgi:hypothetical protein
MQKIIPALIFGVINLIFLNPAYAQHLCPGFGQNGIAVNLESYPTRYNAVLPLPDGKFLAAGYIDRGDKDFLVSRFNADGSLDGSQIFDITGTRKNDVAQCLAFASDGSVLVSCHT